VSLPEALDIVITAGFRRPQDIPPGTARRRLVSALKVLSIEFLEQLSDAGEFVGADDLRDALGVGPRSPLRRPRIGVEINLSRRYDA